MILKHKNRNDFNKTLVKVFDLMSIHGKYNIVGSASLKGIYYNSDIDLNQQVKIRGKTAFESVYNMFVKKFQMAKQNPNIYITDFKAGVDDKNESLKWSFEKLLKEKDAFIQSIRLKPSTIKLDVAYLLNGIFVEITEVYFLDINGFKTYETNMLNSTSIKSALQNEFHEQVKEGKFFKALKRLFSILLIEKAKKPLLEKLISFFNSETGILYKANADLQILINVISNTFRQVKIEDIKNNLQIIKANLSIQTETQKNCSIIIDDICSQTDLNKMNVYIQKLSEYLSKVFNRFAKRFLETIKVN